MSLTGMMMVTNLTGSLQQMRISLENKVLLPSSFLSLEPKDYMAGST